MVLECDQDWLPPQHGDIREVQSCIGHLLAVSRKLMRPTVKGHDTANYERVQLRWDPTCELVGLSSLSPLHRSGPSKLHPFIVSCIMAFDSRAS